MRQRLRLRNRLRQFRNYLQRKKYRYLDLNCMVSPSADIYGAAGISIGAYTSVHSRAVLQCTEYNQFEKTSGSIQIGPYCSIQPYAYLYSGGGRITIGDHCSVNQYAFLQAQGDLTIGNYVRIAPHVVIVAGNHNFDRADVPIHRQGETCLGIEIGDDVWIGAGAFILDGVKIGQGCVIGAGSVVTRSTDAYGIYVGNPARKIKERGQK